MRRIRAGVIGVLGLANVAVACLIWLTGNNPLALGSWQRGAGALGNLAGLTAGSLLALQLLAMARIGPVERALGRDALAAGHRRLAIASMSCLAAHVALTAAERIAREPARIIPTVGGLFATRPWMLFATIGTAALVLVAATSARAARDRLRRESWHLLHLYSYLGAAMSFPHMVFGGADLHRAWAR
ncbi:MAG: ferric reductase-like transmembrane domain-containing protein, partial [Bifidobacteriaceae bacterium]|nr:ferric reductase-like transmembrane domain-containing protein [Bifidobacteriaceae bacterium]